MEKPETTTSEADKVSFLSVLKNWKNVMNIVWFFFTDFRLQAFSAQYQSWIRWSFIDGEEMVSNSDETILFFTHLYNYIMMTGIILSPLLGFVFDKVTQAIFRRSGWNYDQASSVSALGDMVRISAFLATASGLIQSLDRIRQNKIMVHQRSY